MHYENTTFLSANGKEVVFFISKMLFYYFKPACRTSQAPDSFFSFGPVAFASIR